MQPITGIIRKNKHQDANPCLEYHTFWSILHGLVSIKMMKNSDVSDELNKKVLDNALTSFIRNLNTDNFHKT
jgi:hypothetical protein